MLMPDDEFVVLIITVPTVAWPHIILHRNACFSVGGICFPSVNLTWLILVSHLIYFHLNVLSVNIIAQFLVIVSAA